MLIAYSVYAVNIDFAACLLFACGRKTFMLTLVVFVKKEKSQGDFFITVLKINWCLENK